MNGQKSYILNRIIDKYENSRNDWKQDKSGNRSFPVQGDQDYSQIYPSDLAAEAKQLQQEGLIRVEWAAYGSDVARIYYFLDQMPEYYRRTGREPKRERWRRDLQNVAAHRQQAQTPWLQEYYEELFSRLEEGKRPADLEKYGEKLFTCLDALEKLKEPVFIRVFSSRFLGGSKIFEKELTDRVVSIAIDHHPLVDETMEKYQVLAQLYLESYTQELAVKGGLRIQLEGRDIDLAQFPYGTVLNTETLKQARVPVQQRIRKVITVENKANFVSMSFEEGTLLVFSHGFLSPLEREFLVQVRQALEEREDGTAAAGNSRIEYFHTGDLDYGGVRIFKHIREHVFPGLQPLHMGVEDYERYLDYGSDIEESAWRKLHKIREPRLQPLIERMLKERKTVEQECFLYR